MNTSLLSNNRSLFITSTLISRGTTSRIPYREQVLIDAFNTYIQIGIGSILFLFGLTFNCLSLIYFRASRSFRHTTFQLYFSIIAILDTVRLFEFFIFILFDKGYLRVTINLCRWIFFTIMFTGQVNQWSRVFSILCCCCCCYGSTNIHEQRHFCSKLIDLWADRCRFVSDYV
jgi:hypothetical protein